MNINNITKDWTHADAFLNEKIEDVSTEVNNSKTNILSTIVASSNASANNSKTLEFQGTGKALEKLVIEGKTVQDGTPSPSAPVEVKGVGDKSKNLLNITEWLNGFNSCTRATLTKYSDSFKMVSTGADAYTDSRGAESRISNGIKSNTTYTLSYNKSITGNTAVYVFGADAATILKWTNASPITFTTGSSDTSIFIRFGVAGASQTVTFSEIQLEEGSSVTEFIPKDKYKIPISVAGKTSNIYLDAPLYDGDKADVVSGVAEKNREEIYFPTDGWNNAGTSTTDYITRYHTLTGVFANIKPNSSAYCTILQSKADTIWSNPDKAYIVVRDAVYISYPKSIDVVTFINDNNLSAFFELTTPIKETFDAPEIPTSVGKNTLTINTEVTPTSISVTSFGEYYNKTEVDKKISESIPYGNVIDALKNEYNIYPYFSSLYTTLTSGSILVIGNQVHMDCTLTFSKDTPQYYGFLTFPFGVISPKQGNRYYSPDGWYLSDNSGQLVTNKSFAKGSTLTIKAVLTKSDVICSATCNFD